jgi:hypothetical protein
MSATVEWHLPETDFMEELIHIVPADQQEIHLTFDCWCQPEYGKNEQGIKTVTHREGVILAGN